MWCVFGSKQVGSNSTRNVGYSDDSTGRNRRAGRSGDSSSSISDERDDRRVGTSDHEDSQVSGTNVFLDGCEKNITDGDEDETGDNVLSISDHVLTVKLALGRSRILSEFQELKMMTKNAKALGGTVNS